MSSEVNTDSSSSDFGDSLKNHMHGFLFNVIDGNLLGCRIESFPAIVYKQKVCIMKKEYFKPETVQIDMLVENYILNDSTSVPINVNGDGTTSDATNRDRGDWGNLWENM